MRHLKRTAKLGRTGKHRNAMLANLVCSLIKHRRITTTLAKAKAARPVVEKMVTLGKVGSLHARRLAAARLHQEDVVRILFNDIAPTQKERHGGYTRIVRLDQRRGDTAQLAILEWVDLPVAPVGPAAAAAASTAAPAAPATAPATAAETGPTPAAASPTPAAAESSEKQAPAPETKPAS
jgi:large subunit ribosomal protein L17